MSTPKLLVSAMALLASAASEPAPPFDRAAAAKQLREATALCERDDGKLWGVRLCGPMMIVDPATRAAVANVPDPQGSFRQDGDVFIGIIPTTVGLANTAVAWQGMRWTMVIAPLPDDERARAILLMHEAFHRVQPDLGLATTERVQDQLATWQGRLSFRLELRALRKALSTGGQAGADAFHDALALREWRHARFPGSADSERALEANEGLAEYTGWKISGAISDTVRLDRKLAGGDRSPALARSFAYLTGPAYGALLDRYAPGWVTEARPLKAMPLPASSRQLERGMGGLRRIGKVYGYDEVRAEEVKASIAHRKLEAGWRRKLIDGPTITIRLIDTNYVYDPNAVSPIAEGNVYSGLVARGPWGSLAAPGGALMARDWKTLTVGARGISRGAGVVEGPDTKLTLAPGWVIAGCLPRLRLEQGVAGEPPRCSREKR